MTERYIENEYNDVIEVMVRFSQIYPNEGITMVHELVDVHDVPEIGLKLIDEEIQDIRRVISTLDNKNSLSDDEFQLLEKAKFVLCELNMKQKMASDQTILLSRNTIIHNIDEILSLTNNTEYISAIHSAQNDLKNLIENNMDLILLEDAFTKLDTAYQQIISEDQKNCLDKEYLARLIYDIAVNFGPSALAHIECKNYRFKHNSKF